MYRVNDVIGYMLEIDHQERTHAEWHEGIWRTVNKKKVDGERFFEEWRETVIRWNGMAMMALGDLTNTEMPWRPGVGSSEWGDVEKIALHIYNDIGESRCLDYLKMLRAGGIMEKEELEEYQIP